MLSLVAAAVCTASLSVRADDAFSVGGSVRANYSYVDFDQASKDKGGNIAFDLFALKVTGKKGNFGLDAEYRFSGSESTDHFVKYAYVTYDINPMWQVQAGLTKVPFGLAPYASNSWWMSTNYYLGLEDDHDLGIKGILKSGDWQTDFAFFKGAEYSPDQKRKYAGDIYKGTVTAGSGAQYNNEEINQVNIRQAYTLEHVGGSTTFGISGQYGQIFNTVTNKSGDRFAYAAHVNTHYQGWDLQLQYTQYEFNPDLPSGTIDTNIIGLALYGHAYEVASKGQTFILNISTVVPTSYGNVKLYNDFNMLTPDIDSNQFDDSIQNVLGAGISAGPVYTSVDFSLAKNMLFTSNQNYVSGGQTKNINGIGLRKVNDDWDKRININFGYYF